MTSYNILLNKQKKQMINIKMIIISQYYYCYSIILKKF